MNIFSRGNNRSAKITPEIVLHIRARYAQGESQGSIARSVGLSVGQVGRIVRGESWQWVQAVERPLSEEELAASARRLLSHQPDIETVRPEGETALERMQRDIAKERAPSESVDKFLKPEAAEEYIGPDEKEEK